MNWPIGDGESFQGVLDRATNQVHLFQRGDRRKKIAANVVDLNDPDLKDYLKTGGFIAVGGTSQEYYQGLAKDIQRFTEVAKIANITAN